MPKFGTKNALIGLFWATILKILLSYLKSAPSNLSNCKIFQKKPEMLTFGTKNAVFGYFWAGILKNYYHIWNQHLRICLIVNFCKETKMPKFGIKNAIFGIFGQEF